jgi:HipA-like protein
MIMKERRRAAIFQHGRLAGHLHSIGAAAWAFAYEGGYDGPPVSLTLPVRAEACDLPVFPAFLEGLLHETILAGILADLRDGLPKWEAIIRRSFLSPPPKPLPGDPARPPPPDFLTLQQP